MLPMLLVNRTLMSHGIFTPSFISIGSAGQLNHSWCQHRQTETILYLYTVQTTSTKTKPCQKKLLVHFCSINPVTKFSKVWSYHAVLLTLTKGQKSHDVTTNSKLFSDYTSFYNNKKENKAHYKAKNQNTVKTNFHECACLGTELWCPKETSHQVSSQ